MRAIRRVQKQMATWSLLALLFPMGACNKREARSLPPGPPPLPALTQAHGSDSPAGISPVPAAGPESPPHREHSQTTQSAASGGTIRGAIFIADKLKDKAPNGTTLFLVARAAREDGAPGPVVAVQRYTVGTWPLDFELNQHNVMISGTRLEGKVVLSARVDQDGDAMTKQPGDLEGTSTPLTVPAQGEATAKLILDSVRTQAVSPPGLGGSPSSAPPGHPALPPGHP